MFKTSRLTRKSARNDHQVLYRIGLSEVREKEETSQRMNCIIGREEYYTIIIGDWNAMMEKENKNRSNVWNFRGERARVGYQRKWV